MVMPMPAAWRVFVQFWGLSQCQGRHLWLALGHAKAGAATALRHSLGLFDDMASPLRSLETIATFFNQVASPQRVITVLEALEKEQQLSHKEADALLAKILDRVDASGKWI